MKVRLWGTRGSLASPGSETVRYGGNTSCVEVRALDGTLLVLDAGTGIQPLGATIDPAIQELHLLLSHLHMDHLQGLGFFAPLFRPDVRVHIWGPISTTLHLRDRLARYLSPPLFPVRLRDLPCDLQIHDVGPGSYRVGPLRVEADLVCHPGPTLGYRLEERQRTLVYLPDHEPALGARRFPGDPAWTSGFALAKEADVLIHDSQYTPAEYVPRVGWGHSTYEHVIAFARLAAVRRLVTFHHDPTHGDDQLDSLHDEYGAGAPFDFLKGKEGTTYEV